MKIEWKAVIAFSIAVTLFVTLGYLLLNNLVIKYGVLIAYPVFLVMFLAGSYMLGSTIRHGLKSALVLFFIFITSDIIIPPMMIPLFNPTTLAPVQSLASDVFFYTLFTAKLHLVHYAAWALTYIAVPSLCILLLALFLSKGRLWNAIKKIASP